MRWRLLIIVFVLLLTVGCGFGLLDMEKESIPPLKKQTMHVQNSSFEIDIPFELQSIELTNLKGYEYYFNQYIGKTGSNKDVWIMILGASFNKERIEQDSGQPFTPDLDGGLSMAIESMKKKSLNIKEVKIDNRKGIVLNGMNGWEINGSFIHADRKKPPTQPSSYFRGVAFSKGADAWSVLVGCQKGDNVGEKLINMIVNSIRVK